MKTIGREQSVNVDDRRPKTVEDIINDSSFPSRADSSQFLIDSFKRARTTGFDLPPEVFHYGMTDHSQDQSENITEDWLLKRHEKLMQQLQQVTGPNDPNYPMLEKRSRNNTKWYTETYNRNRGIGDGEDA